MPDDIQKICDLTEGFFLYRLGTSTTPLVGKPGEFRGVVVSTSNRLKMDWIPVVVKWCNEHLERGKQSQDWQAAREALRIWGRDNGRPMRRPRTEGAL